MVRSLVVDCPNIEQKHAVFFSFSKTFQIVNFIKNNVINFYLN